MSGYVEELSDNAGRRGMRDMAQQEMTHERLIEIIGAYGASPGRWPDSERQEAEVLLARMPELQAGLEVAAEIDCWLDAAPVSAPSDALVSRLMAARPRPATGSLTRASRPARGRLRELIDAVWPYGSPAVPAGLMLASAAFGILIGVSMSSTISTLGSESAGTLAATETSGTAGEQLVTVALAETVYPEEWRP